MPETYPPPHPACIPASEDAGLETEARRKAAVLPPGGTYRSQMYSGARPHRREWGWWLCGGGDVDGRVCGCAGEWKKDAGERGGIG